MVERFTKSMTVQAPAAPLDTTEETVPTLAPMLPAPEVVQRFIDHGVTHQDDNHALVLRDSQQGWANFAVAMATRENQRPDRMKSGLWIEVFAPLSWGWGHDAPAIICRRG